MQTDTYRSALPISQIGKYLGEMVHVAGHLESVRDHKSVAFLILRDGSGAVQIVMEKGYDFIQPSLGSALMVSGRAKDAPQVKLGGVEILASDLVVHFPAASPLPIAEDSAQEKKFDYRAVSLRNPQQGLVFRVQTTLELAIRRFCADHGFVTIHSPKLMGTFSESGAEAFRLGYFEGEAFLAQSPQFYKQMAIAGGLERVLEIGPVFRAEPSFTTRHETEFTSIDLEMAWIDSHEDVMRFEEAMLSYVIGTVADVHGAEIEATFGFALTRPQTPFPRVTMAQAQAIVRDIGHEPTKTDDLDPQCERLLSRYIAETLDHDFVFVTDYPITARPFYHWRQSEDPSLTRSFDLLYRGIEITSGAQREHRYDLLIAQAQQKGHALGPLEDYLGFFQYGCPPHGGMGIGLARLLMAMLRRASVREVILLSRTPSRLRP